MTIDAYNECVRRYADFLFRFILKHCRHEEDARDIVQNAFEILWNKKAAVDESNAKAFLFKVGYNNMIDTFRKNTKMMYVEDLPAEARIDRKPNESGLKEILNVALNRLPEIQKSAVLLRDYEGYNYAEIGEILNISESQVKVYIHRARVSLKNYLVSIDTVV